jgi:hypothetical protein
VVSVTVCVDAPASEGEIAEIPTNVKLDSTVISATTAAELLNFIPTAHAPRIRKVSDRPRHVLAPICQIARGVVHT